MGLQWSNLLLQIITTRRSNNELVTMCHSASVLFVLACYFAQTRGSHLGGHTSQCTHSCFDDFLCFNETMIWVSKANFGALPIWKHCNLEEIDIVSDCQFGAEREYYKEIQERCNNKTKCGGLCAKQVSSVCGWPSIGFTDYLTIFYDCIPDSAFKPSTEQTTTAKVTGTNTRETTIVISTSGSRHLGLILGVTLIGVLLTLIIAIVSVILITKKKKRGTDPPANSLDTRCVRRRLPAVDVHNLSTVSDGDIPSVRGMNTGTNHRQGLNGRDSLGSTPGAPPSYTSVMALEYSQTNNRMFSPVSNPLYTNPTISVNPTIRMSEIPDEDPPPYSFN